MRDFSARLLVAACASVAVGLEACTPPAEGAVEPSPASDRERSAPAAEAARVETIRIASHAAQLRLRLPGEVEAAHDARLASPQGGYVERVLVAEGQRVAAGQSLAWINRSVADAQLEQAQSQLDLALYEMDVVEKAGPSVSRSRRVRAQAQLRGAQAAHRLAEIAAGHARVKAPFAGVVAQIAVEPGEVIPPGGPVLRLVSTDRLVVSLSISDRDVRWVQPGTRAVAEVEGGSDRVEATISRVGPAAHLESRTFIAEVDVPPEIDLLRPGMLVTVLVERDAGDDVITIPQFALVTRRSGNGVFVVEDGVARWRPLEMGGLLGHDLVVREGLSAGDELVLRVHLELTDGQRVLVVKGAASEDEPVEAPSNEAAATAPGKAP